MLGYDGSEGAKAALTEALALAKALGTSVTLAFGYEAAGLLRRRAGRPARRHRGDRQRRPCEEGLDAAKAIDPSVEVRAETVAGRPADSLIAMAERDHARMIVVGHHGGGTVRGAIMGSVTFKVLHDAPCPVLVVSADGLTSDRPATAARSALDLERRRPRRRRRADTSGQAITTNTSSGMHPLIVEDRLQHQLERRPATARWPGRCAASPGRPRAR